MSICRVPMITLLLAASASCAPTAPPKSEPSQRDPVTLTPLPPDFAAPPSDCACEQPATAGATGEPAAAAGAREGTAPPADSRWQVRRLGDGPASQAPSAARPPQVGRQDIWFNRARLDNALRLLADAGRFNLVLHGELSQSVTAELRKVEPYEALLALADAHGARVRYDNEIVIVSGP